MAAYGWEEEERGSWLRKDAWKWRLGLLGKELEGWRQTLSSQRNCRFEKGLYGNEPMIEHLVKVHSQPREHR